MSEIDAALGQVKGAPAMLSGFVVLGEIGRGGMGSVWMARDDRLDRRVAIKTLHPELVPNETVRTRFMQEARALARVNHPNIVRIYNLGPEDEPPHFVMEYVEGVPLRQATKRLAIAQKVQVVRKIAIAVDFLHQHGIVHRDLKPGNILVDSELEPHLLDFGLVRLLGDDRGASQSGFGVGTPDYFSPEQTMAGAKVDERSDIFALGVILYELLTETLPFRGASLADYARELCTADPMLPRRINSEIPGDLQSVCLKALEKRPEDRYATARDMADDLERVLADEPVLAQPTAFARMMTGRVEQHVRELAAWRNDEIISEYEYERLRKAYDQLNEKEDAWIMQFRRLTLAQVGLYTGAWVVVIGAALILLFHYKKLPPWPSFVVVGIASATTARIGIRLTKQGKKRLSIAYLLALCFLLPITCVLGMHAMNIVTWFSRGDKGLEFLLQFESLKSITNAQVWWAIFLSLPAYVWIRRFTAASVFSLMTAFMTSVLGMVTLLRCGFLKWETGQMYSRMIPIAVVLFVIAFALERREKPFDSQYFYPFAVLFTLGALSGVAAYHTQLQDYLNKVAPVTRGQPEYLFIANAGVYYGLQRMCDAFETVQLRNVAKVFRFVIPGHVMTSVLILGLQATHKWEAALDDRALRVEARTFEVILPMLACFFVFASIPKQMKNYLASGLMFLAIGLVRLQQNMLKDSALWPVALLIIGFAVTAVAVNVRTIRAALVKSQ